MGDNLAEGQEIQDEDLEELNAEDEIAESELEDEPQDDPDEDLPEDLTEPEGDEPEPANTGETEVERLKRLKVLRPGLIENVDDLAKSYKELETRFSQTRPAQAEPSPQPTSQPNVEAIYQRIIDDIGSDDPHARARGINHIVALNNSGLSSQLESLQRGMFLTTNPDAQSYSSEIDQIRANHPSLTYDEAFSLVKGKNLDTFVERAKTEATTTEKARNMSRTQATREKPGGVRATQVSLDKQLNDAVRGKTGEAAVKAMEAVLARSGLGLKD